MRFTVRLALSAAVVCLVFIVHWIIGQRAIPSWHHTRLEAPKAARDRKDPSILCFVLANPRRLPASTAVKETWGRRCDALLFFSSINETTLPIIGLPTAEGYGRLWGKVKKALIYLYHNHLTFDWFLKADDDTYVIVDNLRRLLKQSTAVPNSDPAVWFGCRFKNPKIRQGYMSGGAGYVLSREALKRVVLQALVADSDRRICSDSEYGFEDLELGRCLERVGVEAGDSRDARGMPRFFPFAPWHLQGPEGHRQTNQDHWYWNALWWPHQLGRNCCSPRAISFHKIPPKMMYSIDFLLNELKV